jgi:hypothetical protein
MSHSVVSSTPRHERDSNHLKNVMVNVLIYFVMSVSLLLEDEKCWQALHSIRWTSQIQMIILILKVGE